MFVFVFATTRANIRVAMLRSDGGVERLASGGQRRYSTTGQFTSNHIAEVLLNESGFVSVFSKMLSVFYQCLKFISYV